MLVSSILSQWYRRALCKSYFSINIDQGSHEILEPAVAKILSRSHTMKIDVELLFKCQGAHSEGPSMMPSSDIDLAF